MILQCSICRKYHDGRQWIEPGLFEPKINESQPRICPSCSSQLGQAAMTGRGLASTPAAITAQPRGLST